MKITDGYKFYQKLSSNCPDDEKSGNGPGSCGGEKGGEKSGLIGGLKGLFGKKVTEDETKHPLTSGDEKASNKYYRAYDSKDIKPLTEEHAKSMNDADLNKHITLHQDAIKEGQTRTYDKGRYSENVNAYKQNLQKLANERDLRDQPRKAEEQRLKAENFERYGPRSMTEGMKVVEGSHHSGFKPMFGFKMLEKGASFHQKLDSNCPDAEKTGSGPGSCGGGQTKGKFTFKKVIPTGKYKSFETESHDIKHEGKVVGSIQELRGLGTPPEEVGKHAVGFMVKKEATEKEPSNFKWARIKQKFDTSDDAKKWIGENTDKLHRILDLHHAER